MVAIAESLPSLFAHSAISATISIGTRTCSSSACSIGGIVNCPDRTWCRPEHRRKQRMVCCSYLHHVGRPMQDAVHFLSPHDTFPVCLTKPSSYIIVNLSTVEQRKAHRELFPDGLRPASAFYFQIYFNQNSVPSLS